MASAATTGTVLLVDDSWYVQSLVSELLAGDGHEVRCVSDGTAAVEAYCGEGADVVLMDLVLPDMSGIDACSQIREFDANAQVVFMTGLLDAATRRQMGEAGAAGIVPKPISIEELKRRVEEAISRYDRLARGLQAVTR